MRYIFKINHNILIINKLHLIMKSIMENIEAIRKEKGLKQSVVAEKLGVKQNTYSQYITRNQDIKLGLLSQIADSLNIPMIDIITYPVKYVPEGKIQSCLNCKEKDEIIKSLNEYIKILKKKNE